LFGLGRCNVADRAKQPLIIESVDPVQGGEFDGFHVWPRSAPADNLRFEQPDHGLGQGVVIGAADTPDRRRDADVG
jgi:hypothetical protein